MKPALRAERRTLAAWAAGLALAAGGGAATAQAPSATAAAAAAAGGAAPAGRTVLDRHDLRAQLMPRRYTTLAAEIGAKIQSMPVAEGGAFKAGELIVSFDCSLQRAQLDKARAELLSAEVSFKSNQRMAELNAVGLLELDLSRAALHKAQAELQASQAVVSKCEVKAPFNGRIAEQKAREQQFVQPGQPLADIIDDSQLELEFLVPSAWLSWVRVGGSLRVQIDETRKTYPARFTRLGARVDPVSQSIKVVAAIDGQHPELVAGMSGRVLVAPGAPSRSQP